MIVEIPKEPDDDLEFIAGVNSLLATGARKANPAELFAIRVDNWFDHKWLRFSGKGRVKDPWWEGVSLDKTTALDESTPTIASIVLGISTAASVSFRVRLSSPGSPLDLCQTAGRTSWSI